jgi:hypothetical protein
MDVLIDCPQHRSLRHFAGAVVDLDLVPAEGSLLSDDHVNAAGYMDEHLPPKMVVATSLPHGFQERLESHTVVDHCSQVLAQHEFDRRIRVLDVRIAAHSFQEHQAATIKTDFGAC